MEVGKSGASTTSGRLIATAAGVTLSDNLLIDVQVDSATASSIATNDTFTIVNGTSALTALPTGLTVESRNRALSFSASISGNNVVLTATRNQPQIVRGRAQLSAIGEANGVRFEGNHLLTVPIARTKIGDIGVASVTTTANDSGRINFLGGATVSRRIGGTLTRADGNAFQDSPTNLLDTIQLSGASTTTVTFDGEVGAKTLNFTQNNTASLKGPTEGSSDIFHQMNVATAAGGQGVLRFDNVTAKTANFRGNIGTENSKLASLSIAAPAAPNANRTVRILGNIYANGIALNDGNTLTLGNGGDGGIPFGNRTNTLYTIDAPITGGARVGTLSIRDFKFDLKRNVGGEAGDSLGALTVRNNAEATFHQNIYATTTTVAAATLKAGADLAISGALLLQQLTSGSGAAATILPSTLVLGDKTLTVGGAVTFSDATAANPHTLSFTVGRTAGGPTSGQLDASAGGVTLTSNLKIEVDATGAAPANRTVNGNQFTLVKSKNTPATVLIPAAFDNQVVLSNDTAKQFAFRLSRNTANTDLLMTTVRAGRTIGADLPLDAYGENNGVTFGGDHTLTVPDTRNIGATILRGVDVSLDTTASGTTLWGTVRFQGASTVAGRIGGVLIDDDEGDNEFFLATTPSGLVKEVQIDSTDTVIFNGGVGANELTFSADGTAALNSTSGGDRFHRIKVSAQTGGQGTLSFGNTRDANVLGDIGAAGARLNSLTLAAVTGPGAVRMLGDIQAGSIALNGRPLTLGNGVGAAVFSPFSRLARTYTVNAPITTSSDNSGALNIKDFDFTFNDTIGASAAALATMDIANASVTIGRDVYARRISLLDANAELEVADAAALTGTLDVGRPSADRGTLRFKGAATVNGRIGAELGGSGSFTTPPPTGLVDRIEITDAKTVTFNGGVGANTPAFQRRRHGGAEPTHGGRRRSLPPHTGHRRDRGAGHAELRQHPPRQCPGRYRHIDRRAEKPEPHSVRRQGRRQASGKHIYRRPHRAQRQYPDAGQRRDERLRQARPDQDLRRQRPDHHRHRNRWQRHPEHQGLQFQPAGSDRHGGRQTGRGDARQRPRNTRRRYPRRRRYPEVQDDSGRQQTQSVDRGQSDPEQRPGNRRHEGGFGGQHGQRERYAAF